MSNSQNIFSQFSPLSQQILTTSQQVAESMSSAIGTEHVLIALVITPQTISFEILKEYGLSLEQIRLVLSLNELWNHEKEGMTKEAKILLKTAVHAAAKFKHDQIESEHLLYAITALRETRAFQVIARLGIDPDHIHRQLESILTTNTDLQFVIDPDDFADAFQHSHDHHDHIDGHDHSDQQPSIKSRERTDKSPRIDVLKTFATDITALAKLGKLDPVIGRQPEILRTIQILARRTKNNPILLGAPGVGKTAIIEGLAQRLVLGDVPEALKDKRILRLDLALLVAGTMYRGQFEERLKKILEVVTRDSQIILFIDEIHTMIGTGSAEGSLDAANILKPSLARGELRLIGATTNDDWRKFIEKDPALERRLQAVRINEPSVTETIAILKGLQSTYEQFHHVRFTEAALDSAAQYATRYIHDRSLPDKAIDLLDEAAAAQRIAQPKRQSAGNQKITAELKRIQAQKEIAVAKEAFGQAALLRRRELVLIKQLRNLSNRRPSSIVTVDRIDIAQIVAQISNIPLNHILQSGKPTLYTDLTARLKRSLIDQDQAVAQVAATLERTEAGFQPEHRPLGSFLFLGPTGVGKTELARVLAREVFGANEAFYKIDMSEFMERHTISRLVGAPAGYVGFDEGGKLTEHIRRRPYSLIVFDELEKAHPDIQHLLLQILEDGVLTDAKGRPVFFDQSIIIITSNLGTKEFNRFQSIGFQSASASQESQAYDDLKQRVIAQVKDFFRPEFLNRLDALVVFDALTQSSIHKITQEQITHLLQRIRLAGYQLSVTPAVIRFIATQGFDPEFGARPIRRAISDHLETYLARAMSMGKLDRGQPMRLDYRQGQLILFKIKQQSGRPTEIKHQP